MPEIVADAPARSTSRRLLGLRFLVLTLLGGIVLFGRVPTAQAESSLEQQFLSVVNPEHLAETGQLAHSNVLVDTLAYFPTTTNVGENAAAQRAHGLAEAPGEPVVVHVPQRRYRRGREGRAGLGDAPQ